MILLAGCGGENVTGGGGGGCVGSNCQTVGGGGGGAAADAPTVTVSAGDGQNTLTLAPPAGSAATRFNIYWSTSPDITIGTGTKIPGITSPFTHNIVQDGLANGTAIFYIATVVLGSSQSSPSAVVGGMPGKWTALLTSCTPSPCVAPPARDSHTAVYDATSDKMIVFGGRGASGPLNDLWILQNASFTTSAAWSNPAPTNAPPGRLGHTAVYKQALTNQMTVFGGALDTSGNSLTKELWGLSNANAPSGSNWVLLPNGSGPSERWGHASAYDAENDKMIIFGGSLQTGGQTSRALSKEVWVLHNATTLSPSWRPITTTGGPSARCCMAAGYDPANRRMILFGGFGGSTLLNDLWTLTFDVTFSTATWQELTAAGGTVLSKRCCGVGLWDGSQLLLFGGDQFGTPSSDDKIHALVLQPTTFTVADGPGGGPPARIFPTAVPAGRFLLFGGTGASGLLNDLWQLE